MEIIRTCRIQFLWLAYLVIRNMDAKSLKKVLNYLFYVTTILSCVFLFQLVVGDNLLRASGVNHVSILGMSVIRFYNQPDTLYFFVFLGLYFSPLKKTIPKYAANTLLVAAYLASFHRSWTGLFFLTIATGYVIKQTRIRQIRVFIIAFILAVPLLLFAGHRFMQSRTYIDLSAVAEGSFTDAEFDFNETKTTFNFRMGHLFERLQYLTEHPKAAVLGAGLVPEDSKKVDTMFDFKVGLIEELSGRKVQLDTSDISYSVLFLRYGFLGTFLYLLLYFYLFYFFYKNRRNKYAYVSFLFLTLMFGVSFFSASIIYPATFIFMFITHTIIDKEKSDGIAEEEEMKMIGRETET
jgi:hypothetical protein